MPAGVSSRNIPSDFGLTRPCSMIAVTVPIVPWPHIGRQPEVSMNRIAGIAILARRRVEDRARHHVVAPRFKHQAGADPIMASRKCYLRANMVEPLSIGKLPPVTIITGLPYVWVLMQKNVDGAMT